MFAVKSLNKFLFYKRRNNKILFFTEKNKINETEPLFLLCKKEF